MDERQTDVHGTHAPRVELRNDRSQAGGDCALDMGVPGSGRDWRSGTLPIGLLTHDLLLVDSALRRDDTGPRLAELYLQRAFKLADEDYIGIPPIDEQIRALQGGHDGETEPDQS